MTFITVGVLDETENFKFIPPSAQKKKKNIPILMITVNFSYKINGDRKCVGIPTQARIKA